MPRDGLTHKQRRFVDEYLIDLNATQAYIRAGYSARGADKLASRLMGNDGIRSAITAAVEAQSKRTGVTADVILGELLRLARVDLSEAYDDNGKLKPVRDMPEDLRRAIAGVEVDEIFEWTEDEDGWKSREVVGYTSKVKFWDKNRALELLGKHLKLFTDVVKHEGFDSLAEALRSAEARAGKRS